MLRVLGLGWGLPGPTRAYPYHPDEPLLALAAFRVEFGTLHLSPQFFNYGSLPIYLDRLAYDGAARAGRVPPDDAAGVEPAERIGEMIRTGRWITVLMGVLTIWTTGLLGASLFGTRAGLLAALLLALAPLHLAQGHYATVDVPAGFWTTVCLLLSAGALQTPDRRALALAGLCAGLAASTRYNAGLVLAAPVYALAVTWRRAEWYASDRAAAVVYTPLAAVLAFLVTTPGIVIDSARFWGALQFEWQHSATGHGRVFMHTPPAWLFHLTRSLPDGLGIPLTLAVIAGVVWAAIRHTLEDGLLLIFVLLFFLLIGGAEIKFARYVVPILPALIVLAARLLAGERAPARAPAHQGDTGTVSVERQWTRYLAPARLMAAAGLILWTGCYGVAMAQVFARPDPRDRAAEWVRGSLRPGERVGLGGKPWFYTPPVAPHLGWTHVLLTVASYPLPGWIIAPSGKEEALPVQTLLSARPQYVIVSEFEYYDSLRLRAATGGADEMTALIDALQSHYRLARTFRNRPSLGPLRWFATEPPVHDLLYPMPDVQVYERGTP